MEGGNLIHDLSSPTRTALSPQLSPSSQFNGNSQRRKLVKKKPGSSHHHSSSYSIDGSSLQSKRSSTSLKRAPSASAVRSPASNASTNLSSSPRYPPTAIGPGRLQNASPVFQQNNELVAQHPVPLSVTAQSKSESRQSYQHQHLQQQQQQQQVHYAAARMKDRPSEPNSGSPTNSNNSSRPLSSQTSDELIGAPFDGGAILKRIEATKSPVASSTPRLHTTNNYHPSGPYRPALPTPSYTSPDTSRIVMAQQPAPLRQSASFTAADTGSDSLVNEKPSFSARTDTGNGSSAGPKRYSDENKEPKMPSLLRKKTGISSFMSSLVGSPKKPLISAPENPVHVTHVGYDSQTGQFTVSSLDQSKRATGLLC